MKRIDLASHATALGFTFAAALLAGSLFTGTPARAQIDVHIDIGNAPPPPTLVFRARPQEQYVPSQRVYIVDDPAVGDYDVFRSGGYYWVFSNGYWYRSSSWRGRFVVVNPRYVPAGFYRVPPGRWKHHPNGPPKFKPQGRGNRGHGRK